MAIIIKMNKQINKYVANISVTSKNAYARIFAVVNYVSGKKYQ